MKKVFIGLLLVSILCSCNFVESYVSEKVVNTISAMPTNSPQPTYTFYPTYTYQPKNIPLPKDTPTLEPTVTKKQITTMDQISYSGTGDDVVDVTGISKPIIALHVSGNSNSKLFIVKAIFQDGSTDLLVNKSVPYDGIIPLIIEEKKLEAFEIKASSDWIIEIEDIQNLPTYQSSESIHGKNDTLLNIIQDSNKIHVIGNSDSKLFIVKAYDSEYQSDLLINKSAPYDGTVLLPKNTILIEIKATGPWSINPSEISSTDEFTSMNESETSPTVEPESIRGVVDRDVLIKFLEESEFKCEEPNELDNLSCEVPLGSFNLGCHHCIVTILGNPVSMLIISSFLYIGDDNTINNKEFLMKVASLTGDMSNKDILLDWIDTMYSVPFPVIDVDTEKEIDGYVYHLFSSDEADFVILSIESPDVEQDEDK